MNEKRKLRILTIARSMQSLRTDRCLHFSFILDKNRILCWACNNNNDLHLAHRFGQYDSYKNCIEYNSGRHSEAEALKTFINKFKHSDVSGLTLYNLRIDKLGNPRFSKPCFNCDKNIIQPLNWKNVLWSENGKL